MQHSLIFQQRAAVYQWFSQLLFRELDQKQLARLESEDTRQWLASLAGIPGLSLDVKKLERSWPQILQRYFCWRRLAVFPRMRDIIRTQQRPKNVDK